MNSSRNADTENFIVIPNRFFMSWSIPTKSFKIFPIDSVFTDYLYRQYFLFQQANGEKK